MTPRPDAVGPAVSNTLSTPRPWVAHRRPPGRPDAARLGSTDVVPRVRGDRRGRSVREQTPDATPETTAAGAPTGAPVDVPGAREGGSRTEVAETRAERDARFER